LQALGGSGSIEEIYDKVVELERFPEDYFRAALKDRTAFAEYLEPLSKSPG
jgi:hypothetical protein